MHDMKDSDDFSYFRGDKDKNTKKVYSLHFDASRIALLSIIIMSIIVGTFLFGFFIADGKEKVYNSDLLATGLDNKLEIREKKDGLFPGTGDKNDVNLIPPSNDPHVMKADPKEINKIDQDRHSTLTPLDRKDVFSDQRSNHNSVVQSKREGNSQNELNRETIPKKDEKNTIVPASLREDHKKSKIQNKRKKSDDLKFQTIHGYQIQIASFEKLSSAKKVKAEIKRSGYQSRIVLKRVDGKTNYRVTLGVGKNLPELEKLLEEVRRKTGYSQAFILKM